MRWLDDLRAARRKRETGAEPSDVFPGWQMVRWGAGQAFHYPGDQFSSVTGTPVGLLSPEELARRTAPARRSPFSPTGSKESFPGPH